MNVAETFEWLRERSNRLDEVLAKNEQLTAENVRLALELARERTRPIRERERRSEDMGGLMEMRLD